VEVQKENNKNSPRYSKYKNKKIKGMLKKDRI